MKIISIFDTENSSLFAYQMIGAKQDLFSKAFNNWSDTKYLLKFFEENKGDLYKWYDENELMETAVLETIKEANSYRSKFLRASDKKYGIKLDSMFVNLHRGESEEVELMQKKSPGFSTPSWLRVYAIRIESNCYLVTGSMIKLKAKMQENKDGLNQLKNIKFVKEFLEKNRLKTKNDIIKYIADAN
ncbi:MAG: hypothetical protein V4635_14260 [Bacteroidota bacterium]